MNLLDSQKLQCPYCGEPIEVVVDYTAVEEAWVEDCSVCCRPIELTAFEAASGEWTVTAKREDEV